MSKDMVNNKLLSQIVIPVAGATHDNSSATEEDSQNAERLFIFAIANEAIRAVEDVMGRRDSWEMAVMDNFDMVFEDIDGEMAFKIFVLSLLGQDVTIDKDLVSDIVHYEAGNWKAAVLRKVLDSSPFDSATDDEVKNNSDNKGDSDSADSSDAESGEISADDEDSESASDDEETWI